MMTPVFLLLPLLYVVVVLPGAKGDGFVRDASMGSSDIIERFNHDIKRPMTHGDIAQNAVPCTAAGCLWPKVDGIVKVPFKLSRQFTQDERRTIRRSLRAFARSTCVRFIRKRRTHRDYINIISDSGCWSFLGRQSGSQDLSLGNGCLFKDIVQHEALHALGFHHEQARSDRDDHVRILTENIQPGTELNFAKEQTNNLGTPYDFDSVMHYSNFAFSRNGQPTIEAIDDPDRIFGDAEEMSENDIARVNLLYQCDEE